jgi:hypothetical protein
MLPYKVGESCQMDLALDPDPAINKEKIEENLDFYSFVSS